MRIAQVAPLTESRSAATLRRNRTRCRRFSPRSSSGRVTTSRCSRAETRGPRARSSRRGRGRCGSVAVRGPLAPHVLMLEQVLRRATDFDVIHFHIAPAALPARAAAVGRRTSRRCTDGSICLSSRRSTASSATFPSCRFPTRSAGRCPTRTGSAPSPRSAARPARSSIRTRVPTSPSSAASRRRSASIARSRSRRRAASRCGSPPRSIRPTATTSSATIRPLLDHPLVEFIGEIGERQKSEFLGRARRCSFPSTGPSRSAW